MKDLEKQIEGLLFYKATPIKKSELAKIFKVKDEDISDAVNKLKERLRNGVVLFETETEVELGTNPELDELIETIRKEEMKRDIGKAGAETLAIVLYRGPVARSEIDHIRGVNSSYILRNLEMRGLIERNQKGRQTEFSPTTELLRHLGIKNKSELANYAEVMNALENYEKQMSETN